MTDGFVIMFIITEDLYVRMRKRSRRPSNEMGEIEAKKPKGIIDLKML